MLQLASQMRILVAIEPVDFRNGIDGLVRLCKEVLGQDPFQGTVFAFRNRRGTAVKVLLYDGQGFWLAHKRLSEGRFRWWPVSADQHAKALAAHRVLSARLQFLWRPMIRQFGQAERRPGYAATGLLRLAL